LRRGDAAACPSVPTVEVGGVEEESDGHPDVVAGERAAVRSRCGRWAVAASILLLRPPCPPYERTHRRYRLSNGGIGSW
jgi:hypothetical protein